MAVTYYPKKLVDEINRLGSIPTTEVPILTTWKTILLELRHGAVVGEPRTLNTRAVLCHNKNRGGSMLNGFSAHANGVKVLKIGADRAQLIGAVVFEMSPFPEQRKKKFNRTQI